MLKPATAIRSLFPVKGGAPSIQSRIATLGTLRRELDNDAEKHRNQVFLEGLVQVEREVDELLTQVPLVQLAVNSLLHPNIEVVPVGGALDAAFAVVRTRSCPTLGYLVETQGHVDVTETEPQTYISFKVRGDRVTPPYLLVHGDPLFAPVPSDELEPGDIRLNPFSEIAFSVGCEAERICDLLGITILVVDENSFEEQEMALVQRQLHKIVAARILSGLIRAEAPTQEPSITLPPFEGIDLGRSNIL